MANHVLKLTGNLITLNIFEFLSANKYFSSEYAVTKLKNSSVKNFMVSRNRMTLRTSFIKPEITLNALVLALHNGH